MYVACKKLFFKTLSDIFAHLTISEYHDKQDDSDDNSRILDIFVSKSISISQMISNEQQNHGLDERRRYAIG
jgi:hypothetical protein